MDRPEVTFTTRSAWYSRGSTVIGTSRLTLPVDVTAYISRAGAAHGYWRNAPPLPSYFGYCDVPALMPILIGAHTRRAITQHDAHALEADGDEPRGPIELHIRAGDVETSTKLDHDDEQRVIDDQRAIHHALAADYAEVLASWQRAADELGGSVATPWPPVLTVPRGFGTTTILLTWPTTEQSAASASIELIADARKAKLWTLEREPLATPNTIAIADRPFLLIGEIPLAMDHLDRLVRRAEIMSITVRRHITVRIAGHEPTPDVFDALLDLLGELCGTPSEPYR
ncbi:MAG TPA: hypothetical protein VFV99_27110 [Kofleriaceae bacterium]|nr:hypothetical protein [Kofleriaceae bacterium]